MAFLISTKKGFISASIEPQFQAHGTGSMVTIQLSDYDDVRKLKRHLKSDILFDQTNDMFPFTSFIYFDDLISEFKRKNLWSRLQDHKVDFSKRPVAYYWEAYYTGENADEDEEIDTSLYWGHELPPEIEHARWGFERTPDVFLVYPLHQTPKELVGEAMAHPKS
jgi:hypothetical protein